VGPVYPTSSYHGVCGWHQGLVLVLVVVVVVVVGGGEVGRKRLQLHNEEHEPLL